MSVAPPAAPHAVSLTKSRLESVIALPSLRGLGNLGPHPAPQIARGEPRGAILRIRGSQRRSEAPPAVGCRTVTPDAHLGRADRPEHPHAHAQVDDPEKFRRRLHAGAAVDDGAGPRAALRWPVAASRTSRIGSPLNAGRRGPVPELSQRADHLGPSAPPD